MTEGKLILGIIGVGSIATAIVEGIMRTGGEATAIQSPRGAATSAALASRFAGAVVAADNQAVIDRCEVVLVCVRPQDADTVLPALRALSRHHATPGGINEAFAEDLASAGLRDIVRRGLDRILGRLTDRG